METMAHLMHHKKRCTKTTYSLSAPPNRRSISPRLHSLCGPGGWHCTPASEIAKKRPNSQSSAPSVVQTRLRDSYSLKSYDLGKPVLRRSSPRSDLQF